MRTFPNLGKAVRAARGLEVRTPNGQVVWRFDRDGKKPEQVISQQVATQMIFMMNKVVEEGTGKRAILDGVRAAGKTGTTNAYRDAWFMGYTANYVCGIWFGNDDYNPTNRMTGGSLPAMTWHEIMAYAHQGIEVEESVGPAAAPGIAVGGGGCRKQGRGFRAGIASYPADQARRRHPAAARAPAGERQPRHGVEPGPRRAARHEAGATEYDREGRGGGIPVSRGN